MARTFVPSKRIKKAHRRSQHGVSLKIFARLMREEGPLGTGIVEAAGEWLNRKQTGTRS